MKRLLPLIITVTVACATHAQRTFSIPVPPPPPLEEDVLIVAQAPNPVASPGQPEAARAKRAPGASAALPAVPRPPDEPGMPHGGAVAWASSGPAKYGLFAGGSSSSRRTLVIPKGDVTPELLADAEEDLNVMSLILEKAVDPRSDDEGKKALGIDIFGSSSGIRNVLIEGHGVIFTVKTKIALLPPPTPKKEEPKPKDATSSEWEDAKRQLYGPSEIEKEINKVWGKVQMNFNSNEEYDEQKLQRLKDSLGEALKSASNIRHLSGDQTVTVVALSSSPIHEMRKVVADSGRGQRGVADVRVYAKADREVYASSEGRTGSRMMLQAKKSDIDAYAKGNLTADAFRDKVKIQIY